MNTIKDRILGIIEANGMTQYRFETLCGLSSGYIKSIGEDVGSTKLAKILSKFPNISPDWLILGEGPMFKKDITSEAHQEEEGGTNANSDGHDVLNKSKKYDFDVEEEIRQLRNEVERLKERLEVKNEEIDFYRATISSALKIKKDEE